MTDKRLSIFTFIHSIIWIERSSYDQHSKHMRAIEPPSCLNVSDTGSITDLSSVGECACLARVHVNLGCTEIRKWGEEKNKSCTMRVWKVPIVMRSTTPKKRERFSGEIAMKSRVRNVRESAVSRWEISNQNAGMWAAQSHNWSFCWKGNWGQQSDLDTPSSCGASQHGHATDGPSTSSDSNPSLDVHTIESFTSVSWLHWRKTEGRHCVVSKISQCPASSSAFFSLTFSLPADTPGPAHLLCSVMSSKFTAIKMTNHLHFHNRPLQVFVTVMWC